MKTLIDWSHWQDDKTGPPPDLSKAAGHGVDGFIFKAGRGAGTVTRLDIDPSFPEFVRQAVQLGVPWGAYWWPEPHESDPLGQARLFFATVEAAGRPELPYEVDVEGHRGSVLSPLELATWLRTFVDELRRLSGRSVTVYSADWYWDTQVFPAGVDFSDCALRVSHYFPGTPPAPAGEWWSWLAGRQPDPVRGWSTWSAWQFSAGGNRAGATYGAESGDLDLNVVPDDVFARWVRRHVPVAGVLPVVSRGMSGEPVFKLQALLNVHRAEAGLAKIVESGVWTSASSSATGVAVEWFQRRCGLPVTRLVDAGVWSALLRL